MTDSSQHKSPQPSMQSLASPVQLASAGQVVPWYMPSWGERLSLMGWRVIYFIPAVAVIAYLLIGLFEGMIFGAWALLRQLVFILQWWKLLVLVIGLPTGAAISAAVHAVQNRKEPFCIHCGYTLNGLPDHHTCPECGQPYSFDLIDEYRRDPHSFVMRHRLARSHPRAQPMITNLSTGKKRKSRDGT